jgi:6-pyruvoyltetrahydropterin/6-carboxytetrahydropterin synthase
MRIVKTVTFDAAHHLHLESENRPYKRLHGHSFQLDVEIAGTPDEDGWVADFADITEALEDIRKILDHSFLNEIEGLETPTLENICQFVARRLKPKFPGLSRVSVSRPSIGEACHFDVV